MRKLTCLAAAALSFVVPLTAAAAGHRKPGLWENTVQMNFIKGGPQIPPEQLEKMKQLGIAMPFGGAPQTYKQCLTPEAAAKEDHPEAGQKDCQMQNAKWTGNTFSADLVCKHGGAENHGSIKASFADDQHYTADVHVEGSDPHLGGDYVMENQVSGKWLGADCGSVPAYNMH